MAVAVTLFAVARGGRLRFCRDCKIRNGFPAERGFLGNLFSQEGTYQTRMLLNVSALVTLVGWVYYFLAYVNVNLNEPDRLSVFLDSADTVHHHYRGDGRQVSRTVQLLRATLRGERPADEAFDHAALHHHSRQHHRAP